MTSGEQEMKPKGVIVLITLLLIATCVKAQKQEISSLKTKTVTLSTLVSHNKAAPSRFWILVESEGREVTTVQVQFPRPIVDRPTGDSNVDSSGRTTFGQVRDINNGKRRYSIKYSRFSKAADDLWLQLGGPRGVGIGLVKDLGQMKWEDVDRMPILVLKPITARIGISWSQGLRTIGPEGLIVKALTGHVYAVHVRDDRTDYRVIFRIDSIDANGACRISWKRIPPKWAAWTPAQPNKSLRRAATDLML